MLQVEQERYLPLSLRETWVSERNFPSYTFFLSSLCCYPLALLSQKVVDEKKWLICQQLLQSK